MGGTGVRDLMRLMESQRASDIHLQVGSHPVFRIRGQLVRLTDYPPVTSEYMDSAVRDLLSEKDIKRFQDNGSLDTSVGLPDIGRFRMNVFLQRGSVSLVARRINNRIPDYPELNLPPAVGKVTEFVNGLVLVTGPTGCGKTSTLAAIINHINHLRECHILCIEDPIEYLYHNEKALVNQREVGIDVVSFKDALRSAMRQDPDVILAGEIRDEETVEFALHASETGHLVFGTLHSTNATMTIGRILNFFPQEHHPSLRQALGLHLRAVISQLLLPSCREGLLVVPACEIMFVNAIISRLIREGADEKIVRAINAGKTDGMQDFETALYNLVTDGFIEKEVAFQYAENPNSLEMKLKGIFLGRDGGIIS